LPETYIEKGASSKHAEETENKSSAAQVRQTGEEHVEFGADIQSNLLGREGLQSRGAQKSEGRVDGLHFKQVFKETEIEYSSHPEIPRSGASSRCCLRLPSAWNQCALRLIATPAYYAKAVIIT
jgi:hypothetical protein